MCLKGMLQLATTWLLLVSTGWCGQTLTSKEQPSVDAWLQRHPAYRHATDADCHCADHIKEMKAGNGGVWTPVPDYYPYVATGDFNGDGVDDFAIVVVNTSKKFKNFTLLVFNGPFGSNPASPVFVRSGLDGEALFFGPPRPKPYRLVMGRFNSDNSTILVPRGKTYSVR